MEKGVGRSAFWDCQHRADLGGLTDLWAALAPVFGLQVDLGYSEVLTAPRILSQQGIRRERETLNTAKEDATQQSCCCCCSSAPKALLPASAFRRERGQKRSNKQQAQADLT